MGVGAITAAGANVSETWERLASGQSAVAIDPDSPWLNELQSPVARINGNWLNRDCGQDRSICLGLAASSQALDDAARSGVELDSIDPHRRAVVFGSSKGGILSLSALHQDWLHAKRDDAPELQTFWNCVPPGAASRRVAESVEFYGPSLGISSACSTGLHAIIRGAQMIRDADADIVLAGAGDASIHPLIVGAFHQMKVAASPNGEASSACKPFDRSRTGFVVGEGAAAVLLVKGEIARSNGWNPLAYLRGYAAGHDPTGIVQLDESGETMADLLTLALERGGITADEVGYVSCHGTGTVANDLLESRALNRVFGDSQPQPWVTSLKGAIGHTLGAAGAIEAVLLIESLHRNRALPVANLQTPDSRCEVNLVRDSTPRLHRSTGIVSSMGFGGHLATAVISGPADHPVEVSPATMANIG